MNQTFILLAFMVSTGLCYVHAQETFTLKGKVYDFKTRAELPGATVQLMRTDSTVVTATTVISHWRNDDQMGNTSDFSLTVPRQEATYIIKCSFLGYKTTDMTVTLGNLKRREYMRELPLGLPARSHRHHADTYHNPYRAAQP